MVALGDSHSFSSVLFLYLLSPLVYRSEVIRKHDCFSITSFCWCNDCCYSGPSNRLAYHYPNTRPEPGTFLEHTATQLEHCALYAVMIILPATGYLGTAVNTNYVFMFEIPRFADTQLFTLLVTDGLGISFKEFEIPVYFIHKNIWGEWLAWFLILDHVLAAPSYQFVKKGRTMSKMTTS